MSLKKITAIVRFESTEQVESKLRSIGVPGMSCSQVNGYGEYADFYNSDRKVKHARIEIFSPADQVQEIVDTILQAAGSGMAGDGIVAVLPVEHLYHIRTGADASSNGLQHGNR